MCGCGAIGSVLHLKGLTGRIRITTTIAKAGSCTKDTGTARITTTGIGDTMIAEEDMVTMMMITGTSIMIRDYSSWAAWESR